MLEIIANFMASVTILIFYACVLYGILSYYIGLHMYIDQWLKLYKTKLQCIILYIPFGLYINKLLVYIKDLPWI